MAGQTPETQDAAASQGGNWEQYVTNSVARQHMDNPEESGQVVAPSVVPAPSSLQISYLEGGKYQKRGNVIASGGNFGSGYTISGDSLTKGGSVTHKRSGSMWMPVKSGEKQIYDP